MFSSTTRPREIVLFGVGSSLAADVQESLWRSECDARAIHNIEGPHYVSGDVHCVSALDGELDDAWSALPYLVPLFTPGNRQQAARAAQEMGFRNPANWLDGTVPISPSLQMEGGVYVGPGAMIGAGAKFAEFVLVNRSASIGHHAHLGPFVSIGPGAVLAGEVNVGAGAVIGAGAVVLPQVSIGANAVVAAGAVVTKSVEARCLVAGNPAIVKKSGIEGYQGRQVDARSIQAGAT